MTAKANSMSQSHCMEELYHRQQSACRDNPFPTRGERIDHLQRLKAAVLSHQQQLITALNLDFGYRAAVETRMMEVLPTVNYINYSCKKLKKWMRSERRHSGMLLAPARVEVRYQPLGVVGIIGAWNGPLMVCLGPLIAALSAGNRAIIKLSEFNPEANRVIRSIISEAFAEEHVAVIEGGADISAEFAALPFNHLVFTGSTEVGRKVMAAAAKNLTPVSLELGGKCPVVIGLDMPIAVAVERLIYGKCVNSGQVCLSPDYILLPKGKSQAFVDAYCQRYQQMYGQNNKLQDHTSIHSDRHFSRIQGLLDDAVKKGATATSADGTPADASTRQMATHLLTGVNDNMQVMQQEIFGPLLPVLCYDDVQQALDYINGKPRPLGLYVMSHDRQFQERVLKHTHSGGACINDAVMHALCDDAPFGGIGDSGMGHYHGHEGFKSLSKARTVLKRGRFYPAKFIQPPYDNGMVNTLLDRLLR